MLWLVQRCLSKFPCCVNCVKIQNQAKTHLQKSSHTLIASRVDSPGLPVNMKIVEIHSNLRFFLPSLLTPWSESITMASKDMSRFPTVVRSYSKPIYIRRASSYHNLRHFHYQNQIHPRLLTFGDLSQILVYFVFRWHVPDATVRTPTFALPEPGWHCQ